ncbi:MAG: rhodanese-like domain-containing protein [Burkholderiaceae bacterium]
MRNLSPQESWALLQHQPDTLLLDVRMEIESLYVGRPPGALNIPWYEYPEFVPDPAQFVAAVSHETNAQLDRPLLMFCRSGTRSVAAAVALEDAGYSQVFNMLHGFEGDLNDAFQRSSRNGWRFDGLPWVQM